MKQLYNMRKTRNSYGMYDLLSTNRKSYIVKPTVLLDLSLKYPEGQYNCHWYFNHLYLKK